MPFTEIENSVFREEYELNFGHVKFIVLLRYPHRDVQQAIRYADLEFKGDVQA